MSDPEIILATINARYSHASFGLRWLWANLGPLQPTTAIREFDLSHPPAVAVEELLRARPKIIGFGVYIWNVAPLTAAVRMIKAVAPEIVLVLGGPEVSYEYEGTPIFDAADYLIRGESEEAFAQLATQLLRGERPAEKVITPALPDLDALILPYAAYTEDDLAHRVIYVESSRGCPFRCEFCLSSVGGPVRYFPLEPFLDAMASLLERGVRLFKFVDRTFNVDRRRMGGVLDFFEARWQPGMQLHFEILPDRLDTATLKRIQEMPAGALHLEVGVQTFTEAAQAAISRRQNLERTIETLRFLREETGALLHADLIAGLPGESWDEFAAGFNQLFALRPHAIQVGILKRLRGAPIARHTKTAAMAYAADPPYEVLQTRELTFEQLQEIKRFARYFDLFVNSGDFPASLECLWALGPSPFDAFMDFARWVWRKTRRTHELSLSRRAHLLCTYLLERHAGEPAAIEETIRADYHRVPGRKDRLQLSE